MERYCAGGPGLIKPVITGLGYWGQSILRNFHKHSGLEVVAVAGTSKAEKMIDYGAWVNPDEGLRRLVAWLAQAIERKQAAT